MDKERSVIRCTTTCFTPGKDVLRMSDSPLRLFIWSLTSCTTDYDVSRYLGACLGGGTGLESFQNPKNLSGRIEGKTVPTEEDRCFSYPVDRRVSRVGDQSQLSVY